MCVRVYIVLFFEHPPGGPYHIYRREVAKSIVLKTGTYIAASASALSSFHLQGDSVCDALQSTYM